MLEKKEFGEQVRSIAGETRIGLIDDRLESCEIIVFRIGLTIGQSNDRLENNR